MATETNGIATRGDCNGIASGSFADDLTRCPTLAEILATGKLKLNGGSYANNQCVKYSDLAANYQLSVNPTTYTAVIGGGSFTLNITSNTSWTVSYPSWCSGTTYGSGNASITVYVGSNAGNTARSGSIIVTTDPNPRITKYCAVYQNGLPLYGGHIDFAVKFMNPTPYSRNISGNVSLIMSGVNLGSVYVSGTVVGNNMEGTTLGGGELNDYSSVNKTVPIDFGFTSYSGDSCSGNMEFNVSGNGTGELGRGNWAGSPAGARCTGNVSFINSGHGSILIYAVFTIIGIG